MSVEFKKATLVDSMVKPSAHASHILVASKSEAVQISEKIGKLKILRNLLERNPPVHRPNVAVISGGSEKETWFVNSRKQFGAHHSKRFQPRQDPIRLSPDLGS